MRQGISALLALEEELELVSACGSYDELLTAVDEHRPDVVLTDIRMPPAQTDEGIRFAGCLERKAGVNRFEQHDDHGRGNDRPVGTGIMV